jgi:Tol biopolymer transport system component
MATDNFQSLQNFHEQLLQEQTKITDENRQKFTGQVKDYIERAKSTGSNISATRERDQVRANLRYWANYVYSIEKIFPDTELAPSTQGTSRNWFGILLGAAITVMVAIFAITSLLPRSFTNPPATEAASTEDAMALIEQFATQTAAALDGTTPTAPTTTPQVSPTTAVSGINVILSSPVNGDDISPDINFKGIYENLMPGWNIHVLFIKGDKYFPTKEYYPIPAQQIGNEWTIRTRLLESPEELAKPQSYSIILAISLDDTSRDLLLNSAENGIDFNSLPSTVIPFQNSSAVLLRKQGFTAIQGTRLVYPVFDGRSYDLYSSKPDGSDEIQLTNTKDLDERWPKLSPDGTRLVYVQVVRGTNTQSIHVMDSNGDQEIITSEKNVLEDPQWSPDAAYISYALGDTTRSATNARWSIHIYRLSDGEDENISGESAPVYLNRYHSWLPDGNSLIYNAITKNSKTSGFINVTIDDQKTETLFFDSEREDITPHLSNFGDGYLLTYATIDQVSYSHDIFAVISLGREAPLEGTPIRLTRAPGGTDYPILSPDLKSIFYVFEGKIYKVDLSVDGTNIVLTPGKNNADKEYYGDVVTETGTSAYNPSFDIHYMNIFISIITP